MKEDDLDKLRAIEQRICRSPNPYAGLGELAVSVCRLIATGENKAEFQEYFDRVLSEHALEGALTHQSSYAVKLMSCDVDMFEEVVKVFSLLEEVEAMKQLGLTLGKEDAGQLQLQFARWYNNHRTSIQKAVLGRVDHWSKGFWFYRVVEC